MARKFKEKKLVIASHNKGKIREINELMAPFGVDVTGGTEFNLEEPEETGSTFLANAEIKSRYFAEKTKLPSLADDSGLVVPALDGAPGIYSARWAGEKKDFYVAMEKIKNELEKKGLNPSGQDAHFVCALSFTWPDGHTEQTEGKVFGKLVFPPKGTHGFGYDPIFIPKGHDITFGEMDSDKKHSMSHRADAFNKLIKKCFS